jgi:cytochrome c oxidase subunit 2
MKLIRLIGALSAAVALAGCSSDAQLSPAAALGLEIAQDNGCLACHDAGRVGPDWSGLAGSEVLLEGGSTVVADDAFLRRSIREPEAEIAAGYTVRMPENDLTDAEIEAVIAFIRERT